MIDQLATTNPWIFFAVAALGGIVLNLSTCALLYWLGLRAFRQWKEPQD